MGNWNITIQGTGPHHNPDNYPQDADKMAERFVAELKQAGHIIDSATITYGGRQSVEKKA